MTEPHQRDLSGLFYAPPGNEEGRACIIGCLGAVGFLALVVVLAVVVHPGAGVAVAVIGFVWFWMWGR